MQSALYEGWLRHRRHAPRQHVFSYRLYMLWLDLDEVDRVFAGRWLWSAHRPAFARWRREDHFGDPGRPLIDCVRDEVERACGHRPAGPVRLLTHPRYLGYGFNPASFYYCYRRDGETLDAVVIEVTNTPWGERRLYVLPASAGADADRRLDHRFRKDMHVSPFLPMDLDYRCRLTPPGERLTVHMQDLDGPRTVLDATLMLRRRAITGANLARALLRFPLMTAQVIVAIHWQALRLWRKGIRIHDHPATPPVDPERAA